jgi:hypothetical protein
VTKEQIEEIARTEAGLKKGFDYEDEKYFQREKVRIYDLVVKLLTKYQFTLEDVKKVFDDGKLYGDHELTLETKGKETAFEAYNEQYLTKK